MFSPLFISTGLLMVLLVTVGLWIASRSPIWYNHNNLSKLVAVSTGLLLSLCFTSFLPEIFETESSFNTPLILLGILIVILVESKIAPKLNFFEGDHCDHDHAKDHEHKKDLKQEHSHHLISHGSACSAVGCLWVCAFFDGVKITAGFEISDHTGWLTSLGLFFHILPDGVLAASIALAGGMKAKAVRNIILLISGSLLLGVLLSYFLSDILDLNIFLLPVASGVLLYVGMVHLLPLALKSRWSLPLIALGAAAPMLLHH